MSDLIKNHNLHCAAFYYDKCNCHVAEIERLQAKVEYQEATIKSLSVDRGEDAAEIERLKAVVDAVEDYIWCTADPPTEQMARGKLDAALAALEDEKCGRS